MERRKAITTAAAASLTLLAGAAGIALNSGIVGASGDDNVGQLSPVATITNPPITVYVDDPVTRTPVSAAPSVQPTDSQPVTTSAASGYRDDDRDEDDHESEDHESEDHESEDHESEDHDEYEGAEDDD